MASKSPSAWSNSNRARIATQAIRQSMSERIVSPERRQAA
jgi:hypothetical protein